jgi:hypothetical protein
VKVGDVVRIKSVQGQPSGIIVSDLRLGMGHGRIGSHKVCEVLSRGAIITLAAQVLEVISEAR